MPSSTIVASGGQYRLYDDSVATFDQLPVATYGVNFSQRTGYSLHQVDPLESAEDTVYGSHAQRVDRIIGAYEAMPRSLGVLLSGDKGMGKSLLLRMLAERARDTLRLPTILVQRSTPGLAAFLDDLGEVAIVFDEFEKVFARNGEHEAQSQFLPLFDGISATKRLYIVSVNQLSDVSEFMLNRPGRFHYHLSFAYPDPDTVATYLRDQLPGIAESEVAAVIGFARRYDVNFDHLRAIAFELRRGEPFTEVIGDLNIKRSERGGTLIEARITWQDGDTDTLTEHIDLFDDDSVQTICDYNIDITLRFRMRDAVPTSEGYLLQAGAFQVTDTRDEDTTAQCGERAEAVSVTVRRYRKRRIDF